MIYKTCTYLIVVCREEEMAPDKWRQNMSSAKMAVQNVLTTLKVFAIITNCYYL